MDSTPGGICVVNPAVVDVPALGDAFASYTCSFVANPGSGTNTATATWPDIGSPNTSGSGTAGYVFGSPTSVVNDVIDVVDSNGGSWQFSDSGSVSYPMTYTDPAGVCTQHVNTATITQLGKSASATVTDCQGADLLVEKTAVPSFTREYYWGITKEVDKTYVKQVGGSATFNYTVTVFQTGVADKDWMVSGLITVSNPNDWQDIVFDLIRRTSRCSLRR